MPNFNANATPNQVVEIQTLRVGDDNRKRYIVDEKLYRPLMAQRAITKYNLAFKRGINMGQLLKAETIQQTEELPFPTHVEVTADVLAGATSIPVADSSILQKYSHLAHKQGKQDIRITQDPTSLTAITVEALASAVKKGTLLKAHGTHPGEPHHRSKPKSRSTESHLEWGSKLFKSFAISYEMVQRDMYGIREKVRIQQGFMDEQDQESNRALYFDKRRDGASDGFWQTDGLYWQGYNFGYKPLGTGVLTPDVLYEAAYQLMKFGNAAGELEFISSQRIIAQTASWDQRAGLMRTAPGNSRYGSKKQDIDVPVDGITGIRQSLDMAFDDEGFDDIGLLIYWPNCKPIKQFPDFFQPDVQDPGTGAEQHQWVRYLGWSNPMPGGNIILIEGINEVKGHATQVSMAA